MRLKRSSLAGRWYAGDEKGLRAQVDGLLDRAPPRSEPVGSMVVPHAAYQYSGKAAAAAYASLRAQPPARVAILAPSHFGGFRGAVTPTFDAFETPLGRVPVDTAATARLAAHRLIEFDDAPFEGEHALEIQLPFLQRVAPGAVIIPLLVGVLGADDAAALARGLCSALERDTLLVVSSDFTHYGAQFDYLPFPPRDESFVRAKLLQLDGAAIDLVVRADAPGFRRYVDETGATICGRMPINVLLESRAGEGGGRVLDYYTSLDVTGDFLHSVSYAAIAFPPLQPHTG